MAKQAGVKKVIFYCGSSSGRGPRTAAWLQDYIDEVGDREIQALVMKGGIKKMGPQVWWRTNGLTSSRSLPWAQLKQYKIGYLFVGLAACSFVHTFYYILVFYATSFAEYEARAGVVSPDMWKRVAAWLAQASLFEEVWLKAIAKRANWWWSEQICTYAIGPWTVFLFVEGQRHQIKHLWAYMLLGRLVAVAVPANLFYLALVLSGRQLRSEYWEHQPVAQEPPPELWISILLSTVTVCNIPFTNSNTFLPNLLLMHALTVVPFVFVSSSNRRGWYSIDYRLVYFYLFYVFLIWRGATTWDAVVGGEGFAGIAAALHSHPGQAAIGWDVIWSTTSFVVWTCLDRGVSIAPFSAIFVSAGVASTWVSGTLAVKEAVYVMYGKIQ
ncbi:hypothetical protein PM082_017794 [Marasmius tenuissimus]|nr:hypothetical protein PM082_017794 [Marasmius tenuissimus]